MGNISQKLPVDDGSAALVSWCFQQVLLSLPLYRREFHTEERKILCIEWLLLYTFLFLFFLKVAHLLVLQTQVANT